MKRTVLNLTVAMEHPSSMMEGLFTSHEWSPLQVRKPSSYRKRYEPNLQTFIVAAMVRFKLQTLIVTKGKSNLTHTLVKIMLL